MFRQAWYLILMTSIGAFLIPHVYAQTTPNVPLSKVVVIRADILLLKPPRASLKRQTLLIREERIVHIGGHGQPAEKCGSDAPALP